MEERKRTQGHGPLVESEQADCDLDVAQDVLVRELGTLGLAGRARGVEDHRGVVGLAIEHLASGLTTLEQRFELAGLDEDALHGRPLGAGVGGVGELVPGQDYAGPGVTEIELDLALFEQRVHWHDGGAEAQRAVVAKCELRDVGQHDAHAVSRSHALCAQQSGNTRCRPVKLGVGEFTLIDPDRDVVGTQVGALAE